MVHSLDSESRSDGAIRDPFGHLVTDRALADGPTELKAARRDDPQEEFRRSAGHYNRYAFGSLDAWAADL
jgi:hypothetical protein